MSELEKRFRQLKPKVKPKTIKTYATSIRRLRKVSPNLDYEPVSQYLKKLSVSNALNLLTAVIVLEGRERYGRLFDQFAEDAFRARNSQQFTPAEREKWTSSAEIKKAIERIKFEVQKHDLLTVRKHPPRKLRYLVQYLVLSFHAELQWRSDLPSVLVGRHRGKNYFFNGKFFLNQFKTAKFYRKLPAVFTPSRKLGKLLRQYLEVRAAQELDHDALLFNTKMKPIKRNAFYKFLMSTTKQFVGKGFGVSMMRHVYVTEFLAKNPSLLEKKNKLKQMMQLRVERLESYARRD
jgi:hypothetical protein